MEVGLEDADAREVAVAFGEIEAVADDELIGNFEADEISFELDLAAPDFIEQDAGAQARGMQFVHKAGNERHGFSGVGEASHGQHDRQRAPGSIGASSYPSRVFKGMRMAGRMGGDRVKMKGLKVVKIFAEKNYILVSGSVPGHNNSIVLIQK